MRLKFYLYSSVAALYGAGGPPPEPTLEARLASSLYAPGYGAAAKVTSNGALNTYTTPTLTNLSGKSMTVASIVNTGWFVQADSVLAQEASVGNDYPVSAVIKNSSGTTIGTFTWGGNTTGTVVNGSHLVSDSITLSSPLLPRDTYTIVLTGTITSGLFFPPNMGLISVRTHTLSYGLNPIALYCFGDSILTNDGSFAYHGTVGVAPVIVQSIIGWKLTKATGAQFTKRAAVLPTLGVTVGYGQLFVNDITSQTITTLTNGAKDLADQITAAGLAAWWSTSTPVTTSSDSSFDATHQTVGANESKRLAFNAEVRNKFGGKLVRYVELADATESYRDSGIWKYGEAQGWPRLNDPTTVVKCITVTSATQLTMDGMVGGIGYQQVLTGLTGANAGISRTLVSSPSLNTYIFSSAWPTLPSTGDTFTMALYGANSTLDGLHPTPAYSSAAGRGGTYLLRDAFEAEVRKAQMQAGFYPAPKFVQVESSRTGYVMTSTYDFYYGGNVAASSHDLNNNLLPGDLMILAVVSPNSITTDPVGWNQIVKQGSGTSGGATSSGITLYWQRYTRPAPGTPLKVSIAGMTNHAMAAIFTFRGVSSGDIVIDAVEAISDSNGTTNITWPSLPGTMSTGDYVLAIGADDSNSLTARLSSTSGNIGGRTTLYDLGTNSGNGSGLFTIGGVAEAGSTIPDVSAVLLSSTSVRQLVALALRPIKSINTLNYSLAPTAPTITLNNGDGQVQISITDSPYTINAEKWGIYKSATENGTYTLVGWAYSKEQSYRMALTNGTSTYIRATAWSRFRGGTESPMSAAILGTTSASNANNLALVGTVYFTNTLFYNQITGLFKTGSTVSVTSSDGTTISTKTQSSSIIAYGTFTTPGAKTLTFTENFSGGGSATSTQIVNVVARPSVNTVLLKDSAAKLKARIDNKPTYTVGTINITDEGTTMPAGYQKSHTKYNGGSGHTPYPNTSIAGFTASSTSTSHYDPVEKKVFFSSFAQRGPGNNAVMRQRLYKQTFIVGMNSDGGNVVGCYKARYSDDNMSTWIEHQYPVFVKYTSGSHYFKFDPGVTPPSTGRIWEIEFSTYTYYSDSDATLGFGYEAGETPEPVEDTSPACTIHVDSFANGAGAMDVTKNMGRAAARELGLLNFWNMGIPSHRYTLPASSIYPLGLDRLGNNILGISDVTIPDNALLIMPNITINDFGQTDYTQLQAMFTNLLLRIRYQRPEVLICSTVGMWAPTNYIPTPVYNAIKAAFTDVVSTDPGVYLNDGIVAGWAIPNGAIGSSPNQFHSSASITVTASVTGKIMTVTATSGLVEQGQNLFSAVTTNQYSRVYRQLSGTTGGTGDYELDIAPNVGDITSSTLTLWSENYMAAAPVHPTEVGHVWFGQKLAQGATSLVNAVLAL